MLVPEGCQICRVCDWYVLLWIPLGTFCFVVILIAACVGVAETALAGGLMKFCLYWLPFSTLTLLLYVCGRWYALSALLLLFTWFAPLAVAYVWNVRGWWWACVFEVDLPVLLMLLLFLFDDDPTTFHSSSSPIIWCAKLATVAKFSSGQKWRVAKSCWSKQQVIQSYNLLTIRQLPHHLL